MADWLHGLQRGTWVVKLFPQAYRPDSSVAMRSNSLP